MQLKIKLTGTSPLVLHNNQCADPLNEFKKKIGELTAKKKKTDADHLEIRRLEFLSALYMGQDGPVVPARNLRKMLIEGARKDKNGKQFESGIQVVQDAKIQYEGPRDAEGMYKSGFAWTTPAGNQRATIMRTRPKFDEWEVEFDVEIEEELVDKTMVQNALKKAEIGVGLCDARAIGMGRFKAEIVE